MALNKLFNSYPLPTSQQRQELGAAIGMSARAVQVWFQNKRQNLKKLQSGPGKSPSSPQSMSPSGMAYLRNDSPSPSVSDTVFSRSASPAPMDRHHEKLFSEKTFYESQESDRMEIPKRPFSTSVYDQPQARSMPQRLNQSLYITELARRNSSSSLPSYLPSIKNLVTAGPKPVFQRLDSVTSQTSTLVSPVSYSGDNQACELMGDTNSVAAAALLGLMTTLE